MIQEKQTMDFASTNKDVKEKILQQMEKKKNPITEFFDEFQEIQRKLKEQNEQIVQYKSTIHDLMNQQGLEDKYSMLRRQLLRSEMRCVSLQNKLIALDNQHTQMKFQLQNFSDQNEALKMKNEALNKYLREYEQIIKEQENEEKNIKKNKESSSEHHLCQSCLKHGSEKRTNSLDLSSSFFDNNSSQINMQSAILPQKSQSSDQNLNSSIINLSKSSISQFDQRRTLERSSTVYNHQNSAFENDMRLNRSKTVKQENKSDLILKTLNLKPVKSYSKLQDCSIYQIEESHDSSNLATINAKSELKILNSVLFKETQSLSTINHSITETIRFSTATNLLLQGGQDKCITVYQCDPYRVYHYKTKLPGHNQTVKSLQFHKITNDTKIISGSSDQTVRLWDLNKESQQYFVRTGSMVNSIDCFNYGEEILSGHNDGSIKLIRDKNILNTVYLEGPCVTHVQISGDDLYALAANSDGQDISYIDLRMMKILHKFSNINYLNTSSYNKPTFAFDDRYIVAGSNDGEIYIWSLEDKLCPPSVLKADKNCTIHCTIYNRNSQQLFSSDSKGNVNIWKKD